MAEKGGVYVLDEPTTGLHLADIQQLLGLLDRLVDAGKSVIVIEHHPAVMAHADWIIDLGPGAGHDGGQVVFEGSPADLVAARSTLTGEHLAAYVGLIAERRRGPPRAPTRSMNRSRKSPARTATATSMLGGRPQWWRQSATVWPPVSAPVSSTSTVTGSVVTSVGSSAAASANGSCMWAPLKPSYRSWNST